MKALSCNMGVAHVKCKSCWVSLNLRALGFLESVFLVSLRGEGVQEASPLLKNEHVQEPSRLVD